MFQRMKSKRSFMKPQIDLRALRKSRSWTQVQTAAELGFCRTYISAIENGKQGISLNMMAAIVRVFGVMYEDFYNSNYVKK